MHMMHGTVNGRGGGGHALTEYTDRSGDRVVIIQAESEEAESLAEGKAIDVRGHRGVLADGTWYRRERGWVLAAPADRTIAERLS